MNLATRCTECATTFRVVADQLKVSEGWVRCGRCNAVFNAQEQLVDLDAPLHETEVDGSADAPGPLARLATTDVPPPRAWSPQPARAPAAPAPPRPVDAEPSAAEAEAVEPAIAAEPSLPPLADSASGVVVAIAGAANVATEAPPVRIDADEAQLVPSFMRDSPGATASGRWPRTVMLALCAVLATALLTQCALAWRNELAARSPALRPALLAVCAFAGCTVEAPRRIDSLSVEASGLVRIEGAALHRLTVTLRNRGEAMVLPPAIELALTDAQGTTIARRVLGIGEFGQRVQAIGPGADLPLQALLATGDRRISGYSVEVFYP